MTLRITSPSYSVELENGTSGQSEHMEFEIEKGDTEPALTATLLDGDGEPIDLNEASRVIFKMGTYSDVTLEEKASFVDRDAGKVEYRWSKGDTDEERKYKGQFRVKYRNGKTASFPRDGKLFIRVISEIGH